MNGDFEVRPFPRSRQFVVDVLSVANRRPMIHGLLSVDVTEARRLIEKYREKTSQRLSFTAFIITCLAEAVGQDKMMHAYRDWRNRLVLFEQVDVVSFLEIDLEGHKFPLPHIFRAANHKTVRDIHTEIRAVQARHAGDKTSAASGRPGEDLIYLLPAPVRRLLVRVISGFPGHIKKMFGTVCVTAVGMFGKENGGWGIPVTNHTLNLTIGGIEERWAMIEGEIASRQHLCLTITADHNIVDGAVLARFAARLTDLIEEGFGLREIVLSY